MDETDKEIVVPFILELLPYILLCITSKEYNPLKFCYLQQKELLRIAIVRKIIFTKLKSQIPMRNKIHKI